MAKRKKEVKFQGGYQAEPGDSRLHRWKDIRRPIKSKEKTSVSGILSQMASTYRDRQKIYGDSQQRQAKIMMALFPNGIRAGSEAEFVKLHMIDHIVIKLTRFANSGMKHKDSIHDLAVYAAIFESLLED